MMTAMGTRPTTGLMAFFSALSFKSLEIFSVGMKHSPFFCMRLFS